MADYKFNAQLIPNVLADQVFQSSGIYKGWRAPHRYAVIDPRRHTIKVWQKSIPANTGRLGRFSRYRETAKGLGSHYFTNGPYMGIPANLGYSNWQRRAAMATNPGIFQPMGKVLMNQVAVAAGLTPNAWFHFSRTGAGSITNYKIAQGATTGDDGIGSLPRLINNNAPFPRWTSQKALCLWGLYILDSPYDTTSWGESTIPYLPSASATQLLGLIVVAAKANGRKLPAETAAVGVDEAVGVDGSNSVLIGYGNTVERDCHRLKDNIQQFGFYCA